MEGYINEDANFKVKMPSKRPGLECRRNSIIRPARFAFRKYAFVDVKELSAQMNLWSRFSFNPRFCSSSGNQKPLVYPMYTVCKVSFV